MIEITIKPKKVILRNDLGSVSKESLSSELRIDLRFGESKGQRETRLLARLKQSLKVVRLIVGVFD